MEDMSEFLRSPKLQSETPSEAPAYGPYEQTQTCLSQIGPIIRALHFAAPKPSEAEVEPQESQNCCLPDQGHVRAPQCDKKHVGSLEAMGSLPRKNPFSAGWSALSV